MNSDVTNTQQPLRGVLEEFRTALREEVFAAQKSSSSNAVPLTNGRRIGQVGAMFQYSFTVDSLLNVPGDAPGDLIVSGKRLPVVIVSTEGLTITLSVEIDLGEFIRNARLQTDLTFLLRKLIERIEALNATVNAAGDRILGFREVSGAPESISVGLNPEQNAAVGSSLGRDTTFIWGPPGTGKTKTIGAIGAELAKRSRSVLLVSHTNAAVDGALLQIADGLGDLAKDGGVLRVGVPKESKLKENPDLLLSTHVEKRSAELTARASALDLERREKMQTCLAIQRLIAIREWLDLAVGDIEKATSDLEAVRWLESEANASHTEFERLQEDEMQWKAAHDSATRAKQATLEAEELRSSLEGLKRTMTQVTEKIVACERELATAKVRLRSAEALQPFRQRRQALPALAEQSALSRYAHEAALRKETVVAQLKAGLSKAEELYKETTAASPLTRLWKGLPKPEVQRGIVEKAREELTFAEATARTLRQRADEASAVLKEIRELEDHIAPYVDIPWEAEQRAITESVHSALEELLAERKRLEGVVARSGARAQCLVSEREAFEDSYHALPDEVLTKCAEYDARLQRRREETRQREKVAAEERGMLESSLRLRVGALREFKLLEKIKGPAISFTAEDMVPALSIGYEKGKAEVGNHTLAQLCEDRDRLNERLRQIAAETEAINEQLKRVEEVLISEARVIATTLTRAYLCDTIQKRRFDTVMLDEASMAPIPALYVAASLADRNVIAVGDFKQLPPIVQSEHELARKWLGEDVFKRSGVEGEYNRQCPPGHFIELQEQHRMHPDIAAIANELFYDRQLRDADSVKEDGELDGWYRHDWEHDTPVLLVDTGPIGAWVTSVAKGVRTSRLNFLSATVCVDLAERLIREGVTPGFLSRSHYLPVQPTCEAVKTANQGSES